MGYHLTDIPRGKFGEPSKITEEYLEFIDALEQNCEIMALFELTDLIGAIEGYVKTKHNMELSQLLKMKDITKRVFESGYRQSR